MKRVGTGLGARLAFFVFMAMASILSTTLKSSVAHASATVPTYSIDHYVISAGGRSMRGNCFLLSGTLGQTAPGYSSASIFSLIAGYWQPAASATSDEIFFNGFEGC